MEAGNWKLGCCTQGKSVYCSAESCARATLEEGIGRHSATAIASHVFWQLNLPHPQDINSSFLEEV